MIVILFMLRIKKMRVQGAGCKHGHSKTKMFKNGRAKCRKSKKKGPRVMSASTKAAYSRAYRAKIKAGTHTAKKRASKAFLNAALD